MIFSEQRNARLQKLRSENRETFQKRQIFCQEAGFFFVKILSRKIEKVKVSFVIMRLCHDSLKESLILHMFRLYNVYAAADYSILCYEMKKKIFYMFRFYNVYVAMKFAINADNHKSH